MKKRFYLQLFVILISMRSFSQITFVDGYIITESDQKISCLIKDSDWSNNPDEFKYKISENDSVKNGDIQSIKEFGINGISRYIKASVEIDRSSDEIKGLGSKRNPVFHQELLFLKVIIEGKASLYSYTDGSLTRYFYKSGDSVITQLVHKCYLVDNYIETNNLFRQQLFLYLVCQNVDLNTIEQIEYKRKDLENYFKKYNECVHAEYVSYESQKRDLIKLSIRPGLNFSSVSIENSRTGVGNTEFGNKLNARIGIEAAFILPFNTNKWEIIIEPTYQYFKSQKATPEKNLAGNVINTRINYSSFELPFGVRYNFFLNNKSCLFLNTSIIPDFDNDSEIVVKRNNQYILRRLKLKSGLNLGFGLGYCYKNKFSCELRYQTSRDITRNYWDWFSNYSTFSILFGYVLF